MKNSQAFPCLNKKEKAFCNYYRSMQALDDSSVQLQSGGDQR